MRAVREPYHPSQTATGETYVVDGRSNRVVATFNNNPDTTVRWILAKSEANRLNAEFVRNVYSTRQRVTVAVITLAVILAAIEVGTGDLSRAVENVISLGR